MVYSRRYPALPGLILCAGLGFGRTAAAQGADAGGSATAGAATPSATTADADEESPETQAKENDAGPRAAAVDEQRTKPVAAAPNAALTEIDAPEDHWEFFTNGRIGGFFSWAKGDGMPQATAYDVQTGTELHKVNQTGGTGQATSTSTPVLRADGTPSDAVVNHIDTMRVRSGFTGNVVGGGVKRRFGDTKVTGYFSVTSIVDTLAQKKYFQNYPDVREAYMKVEGKWGSFLAGRAAALFNRGAVQTDFMYLHGYGLGFPGDLQSTGAFPTAGQIGFGVLANGYAPGLVYATPKLVGVQLSVGIFDPALMTGSAYERLKYPRPEFELTVDEPLGDLGKVHVYFNGGYQTNYKNNAPNDNELQKLMGIGYGGRIELGPVHLGAGGHRGRGLGLTYPGLGGDAAFDGQSTFRETDGFFVMGQVVLGNFDLNAGFGRSVIHMTPFDLTAQADTGQPATSYINSQTGVSGAVVYHAQDWLHFDVDVMHADSKWDLGERQQITFYNAGSTITW